MQVNSISNYSYNQPSFGMAKLTAKGREVAGEFLEAIPEFMSSKAYTKKNLLKSTLKAKSVSPKALEKLFSFADTPFADKNAQFVKKQILPPTGYRTIKKYLAKSPDSPVSQTLTTSLQKVFDDNISNPQVTSKQGKKILDLIKDLMPTEELTKRLAVISDRIFSK